jgi:hypothetical protein
VKRAPEVYSPLSAEQERELSEAAIAAKGCCMPRPDRELWCSDLHWYFCHAAEACGYRSNMAVQLGKVALAGSVSAARRFGDDDGNRMQAPVNSEHNNETELPRSKKVRRATWQRKSWRRICSGNDYTDPMLAHFGRDRRIWAAFTQLRWPEQELLRQHYELCRPYAERIDDAGHRYGPEPLSEGLVRALHRSYYQASKDLNPRLQLLRQKLAG